MNFYLHVIICVFCVFILYIFSFYNNSWKSTTYFDQIVLVAGVLSARDNFDLREAARSSWLKHHSPHGNQTAKAWFIVGKGECRIPPEYRLNKYGCDKWKINKDGLVNNFYTSQEIANKLCVSKEVFRQGFSFKVNHPIIVKRLGILFCLLIPNTETNVAILDIQSKEILVQTSIVRNSSLLKNGYLYADVETILLPKDYEGMILVEGFLQKEACASVVWNDGGGVITFNRIYSTPSHLDSIEFKDDIHSAASIQFLVHDVNSIKDLISAENRITSQWLSHLEKVNEKLYKESTEKQDILFVDVMDTYRNLPVKLLHFYKWVNQNYKFSFLMKTDDDTVVNIDYLIEHLRSHPSFKKDELWIWSWFRKDWPVNYIGKWADYDHRSPIYPIFPCGALYIMSHEIVQWLSLNSDFLFPYQGEDVSIGIWLSAIKPAFIDDENFSCDSTCSKSTYNRAQLTATQMHEIWSIYETCNNLCFCD